jgi:WD40 repeat protein
MKKLLLPLLLILLTACTPLTPTAEPKIEPSATLTLTLEAPTPVPPTPQPTPTPPVLSIAGLFTQGNQAAMAGARQLVWVNDGLSLALVSENGVAILDADTLAVRHTYFDSNLGVILGFSADGRTLAVTRDQSNIDLIDIFTSERRTLETGINFSSAYFSPEGSLLVLSSNEEWAAHIWDVQSGQFRLKLTGFETAAPVYQVRFAASVIDLLWIARGTVQVQNIPTGQLFPALGHEDFVTAFALANGEPLLVTSAGGSLDEEFTPLLYVWDAHTGEEFIRIRQDQIAYSLHFSPNDRFLAAGEGDNVVIFSTADMLEVDLLPGHSGGVVDVQFSPNGNILAVLDGSGSVRLWHLAAE